jgi:hypothetical protein
MSRMARPGVVMEPHSRHLSVSTTPTGIGVAYDFPGSITLHSQSREKELRRRIKRKLRFWRPVTKSTDRRTVTAEFKDARQAKAAIEDIDRMLDLFAGEKLTPKMVEEILGITSAERVRWNKDGRLPKSGTGSFRKGRRVFQFYLHPAADIARLAAEPTIIAQWRESDAKARARRSAKADREPQ